MRHNICIQYGAVHEVTGEAPDYRKEHIQNNALDRRHKSTRVVPRVPSESFCRKIYYITQQKDISRFLMQYKPLTQDCKEYWKCQLQNEVGPKQDLEYMSADGRPDVNYLTSELI